MELLPLATLSLLEPCCSCFCLADTEVPGHGEFANTCTFGVIREAVAATRLVAWLGGCGVPRFPIQPCIAADRAGNIYLLSWSLLLSAD